MNAPHPILLFTIWLGVVAFAGVVLYQNIELQTEAKRLQHEVDSQAVLQMTEELTFTAPPAPAPAPKTTNPTSRKTTELVKSTGPESGRSGLPTAEEAFSVIPDVATAQKNFERKSPPRSSDPIVDTVRTPLVLEPVSATVNPVESVGELSGFADGGEVFGEGKNVVMGNQKALFGCKIIDVKGSGAVGINRGTDEGLRDGMVLNVMRNNEFIGRVQIGKAGPFVSVGRVLESNGPVNVNDRCILGN